MPIQFGHGGDILTAQAVSGGPVLDFSANLNPLGMPPEVSRAALEAACTAAGYPDPLCRALRTAIARRDGVKEEQILCGNGAADLIFRLAYALRPRAALLTAPSFSEYAGALEQVGCEIRYHTLERTRNFDPDERLLDSLDGVQLVILCSPNNPTGRLIPWDLLLQTARRCRELGSVLMVDECFLALSDEPEGGLAPWLEEYPNLVLLRAFTKSYAMAGLRLGYCLCADEKLLERMALSGPPWSVSAPAQAAGLAALERPDWPALARAEIARNRPGLQAGLERLGAEVVPGQANYLLFRVPGVTDLARRMVERGILIRSCGNYQGLWEDYYRVCVRSEKENRRLLAAMSEVLSWQKPL
jgi:threonine-phosphate decarboxylase